MHPTTGHRNRKFVLRHIDPDIDRWLFVRHAFIHRRSTALAATRSEYRLIRHPRAAGKRHAVLRLNLFDEKAHPGRLRAPNRQNLQILAALVLEPRSGYAFPAFQHQQHFLILIDVRSSSCLSRYSFDGLPPTFVRSAQRPCPGPLI
jgi:hypothetical protein